MKGSGGRAPGRGQPGREVKAAELAGDVARREDHAVLLPLAQPSPTLALVFGSRAVQAVHSVIANTRTNRGPSIQVYSLLGTVQEQWLFDAVAPCQRAHLQTVVDAQLAKQVLYIWVRPAATLRVGARVGNRGAWQPGKRLWSVNLLLLVTLTECSNN